jgi:hypothetical protein
VTVGRRNTDGPGDVLLCAGGGFGHGCVGQNGSPAAK